LEYASCDVFKKVVQWGLFGGDGLFSTVKEETHRYSSAQEKALQLIHPHACSWTLISAARPGRATVRASLNVGELLIGLTSPDIEHPFLEASWPIAAFAPLTLEQASSGNRHGGYSHKSVDSGLVPQLKELLLVPRSSMTVILRGGPERWRQGVEFVDSHEVLNDQGAASKENVGVSHLKDGGNWVYNIECKNLGNYVSAHSWKLSIYDCFYCVQHTFSVMLDICYLIQCC
jgi:nuclear pore complex protein Nup210